MKIGNLSQALVRPPHIFINPNGKIDEINTFRIPKQSINKRYFRERDFIKCPLLSSMNYNRNYRHRILNQPPFKTEEIFLPLTVTTSSQRNSTGGLSQMGKLTDYMKRTNLSKLSNEEFHNTMQTNVTKLLKKINADKIGQNEMTERTEGLFVTNKFPKTTMSCLQDKEMEFSRTLNKKIRSLALISSEVKRQISYRNRCFRGLTNYQKEISQTPSFRDTIRYYTNK